MSRKRFIRTRKLAPIPAMVKGGVALMCPFCNPTHEIKVGGMNICGTKMLVMVEQPIIGRRTVRDEGLICKKCRKGGGEMVHHLNGYIHLVDCALDVKLLNEMPEFSRWAAFIYKLSPPVRSWLEKRTGIAQVVEETDREGAKTGRILGYFFLKR